MQTTVAVSPLLFYEFCESIVDLNLAGDRFMLTVFSVNPGPGGMCGRFLGSPSPSHTDNSRLNSSG